MEPQIEAAWKNETGETPRRRRIPIWLRVWAAACLGCFLLLVVGVVWLVRFANRMVDPREQWASVREVIAVDEPPPPYTVLGIPSMGGLKAWGMSDHAAKQHFMLCHVRGERAAETRAAMLAPGVREVLGTMMDPAVSVERGMIVVQGRELRCMRFRSLNRKDEGTVKRGPISIRFGPSDSGRGEEKEPGIQVHRDWSGPAILVDLSRGDPAEFLACMMLIEDGGGRIEDAQVVEFLKPFHVGPYR